MFVCMHTCECQTVCVSLRDLTVPHFLCVQVGCASDRSLLTSRLGPSSGSLSLVCTRHLARFSCINALIKHAAVAWVRASVIQRHKLSDSLFRIMCLERSSLLCFCVALVMGIDAALASGASTAERANNALEGIAQYSLSPYLRLDGHELVIMTAQGRRIGKPSTATCAQQRTCMKRKLSRFVIRQCVIATALLLCCRCRGAPMLATPMVSLAASGAMSRSCPLDGGTPTLVAAL